MNRRGFLLGLGAGIVAAPSIVRAASLMPIRGIVMDVPVFEGFEGPNEIWAYPGGFIICHSRSHLTQMLKDRAADGGSSILLRGETGDWSLLTDA